MPGLKQLLKGLSAWLVLITAAAGGDWPQILGPQRNGIAEGEALPETLTDKTLKAAWTFKAGSGLAGVAVQGATVVLFHRQADDEVVTAIDVATGKARWNTAFAATFEPSIVPDDGPRCVPVIAGDMVVVLGAAGTLAAVELETGAKRWQHDLQKEFQAPTGYFGFGTTPLVYKDLVLVNVGGDRSGAGVVAFDRKSGDVRWKMGRELGSYSAPLVTSLGGEPTALVITRLNLLGLDPASGKERFRTPFGARGPTVNGATPVVNGEHILLTASYGIGARLLKASAISVATEWDDEILSSQYTTPIWHEGAVYGVDGRQDGGPVSLKCFDPLTRKIFWEESDLPYSTLIAADGKLLIFGSDGQLRAAKLQTTRYQELGRARVTSLTARALPALANGRIYVRDEQALRAWDWKTP